MNFMQTTPKGGVTREQCTVRLSQYSNQVIHHVMEQFASRDNSEREFAIFSMS